MENIEEFRKYIKITFSEYCNKRFLMEDDVDDDLNKNNLNHKNHIFSTNDIYYANGEFNDIPKTKCINCNTACAIYLNYKNEIIFFNYESKLNCKEIIIKNIIE